MAGKWPQTVGERLINETARSCAPVLAVSVKLMGEKRI